MNTDSLISVIMPVYNAEIYLTEAIESVLHQTYRNFEFIIINDGSTDTSMQILAKFADLDERITLISRENRGIISTLNEGIKLARGKYIARMDADDISLPQRFEEQIALMENEELDICGCHYEIINSHGKNLDIVYVPLEYTSFLLFLPISVPFAHGSVMFKKSFLHENKLAYGQKFVFAEDKNLWIQIFDHGGKFGNVNNVLFSYRDFGQSLSKLKSKNIWIDNNNLKKLFIKNNLLLLLDSVETMSLNIDKLSVREIEHLADLIFYLIINFRKLSLVGAFRRIPARYKGIAFLKFASRAGL